MAQSRQFTVRLGPVEQERVTRLQESFGGDKSISDVLRWCLRIVDEQRMGEERTELSWQREAGELLERLTAVGVAFGDDRPQVVPLRRPTTAGLRSRDTLYYALNGRLIACRFTEDGEKDIDYLDGARVTDPATIELAKEIAVE
jgi:hypothetical protein